MKFRSDPAKLRGSIAPIVTPFHPDGEVDLDSVHRLVRWQLDNGSDGISSGGSTGEPTSLSLAERATILAAVANEAGPDVPFMPGTGSVKIDETLELTGIARDLGADAVLVVSPYYARPTQRALVEWYSVIAAAYPDLPIVVYNVPFRTAVDVAPETLAELRRKHDNVVGIKETTKDFEHVSRVFSVCGRDTLVWCGIELLCLPTLLLGGTGLISAAANIAPGAIAQLAKSFDDGDQETALRLHYELHPLVDLLFVETNPAPVKWLLEQLGVLPSGHVRLPLLTPVGESQKRILELYDTGRHLVPAELVATS